jgi:hypothetical protein
MTEAEDLMLMRLADGDLPEPEAAALRARLKAEPALAARYALFAETRRASAEAFAPVLAAPVPEKLIAAVRAATAPPARSAEVLPFRRRAARFVPLALAASVAALLAAPAGWLLGRQAAAPGIAAPFAAAGAVLAAALERDAAGAERRDGAFVVRMLATHPTPAGVCRDFRLDGPDGAALGLACRAGENWRVRASVALEGGDTIRPADGDHPVIAAALERLGAEPPLDEAREAALIRRGWR